MSETKTSELGCVTAQGSPREIGRILGEAGREAVYDVLLETSYWQRVTDPVHARAVQAMSDNLQALFPAVWEEINGLAEGLNLPLERVFAWNCRGDLMSNVPDGCTTVQIPGPTPVIGHNEDGLPAFLGHAFVVEVTPDDGPSLMSFCYPGSIPGHTFAVNDAGLAQAVNNLRLHNVPAKLPRIGLARALLTCESLNNALDLLAVHNACGGFHMTLAQAGDPRLMSVEFGGGISSAVEIDAPTVHANHAIHMSCNDNGQAITASSRDRQARGRQMFNEGVTDPLRILRDTGGPGLPIHRSHADDPDHENTLASVLFRVGSSAVNWRIYDQASDRPVFTST